MQRSCDACGQPYEAKQKRSRFCSTNCRVKAHRGQVTAGPTAVAPVPDGEAPVVVRYRKALADAGRLETPRGEHVLMLAQSISTGAHTAAGMASLSRELREAFDKAIVGATQVADPVDEFTARRLGKVVGA